MTPPRTLEEAEKRRQELRLEIQTIQAQLGDRQRTNETGERLGAQDYWAWKKKATYSLNRKLAELRDLKDWIRENRRPEEALLHLTHLYRILVDMREEDVEFDPDEIIQLEAAGEYLRRLSPQPATL